MNLPKTTARTAGLLYLIVVLTGIFSLAYVPARLIVWNDAAKTVQNIVANEQLFRLGIASSIVCYATFLLLPLVLYRLLKPVQLNYARLMVILAIVSVPISLLNLQHKFSALSLVKGAAFLNAFDTKQLQAQVMFHLKTYNSGILIAQLFWGLWLFPFGYLVYKSNFLPKILGILLMLGCVGYVIDLFATICVPGYNETIIADYITRPAALGEIGTCLWLLIVGIRNKDLAQTPNSKAA